MCVPASVWILAGSDDYHYGIKADLICFCKALANGYNMSAVCGREAYEEYRFFRGVYRLLLDERRTVRRLPGLYS